MTIDRPLDRTRTRQWTGLLAGALLLLLRAGVAPAQQSPLAGENVYPAGEPSSSLELTAWVGVLTPLGDLASQEDGVSAEFSTQLAFSLGLDLWFPSGLGIGVLGGYSRPDFTYQLLPAGGTFPVELDFGATDYVYGVGTLQYRPNLGGPAALVRPYFLAGGGVLHTGSAAGSSEDGEITFSMDGRTRPVGVIGFGGHVLLGKSWFLRLEIRDYVSSFDSEPFEDAELQNDLIASFGLGIAL
jgi:hypothetical protein